MLSTPNINNIIHSMYNNSWNDITVNFELCDYYKKDENVFNGKAIIGKEKINLITLCAELKTMRNEIENKYYKETVPTYYTCKLTNFPQIDIKDDFKNKEIKLDISRVMINSSISFSTYNINEGTVEVNILRDKDGKLADLTVN